jgi:hypothetical protein
VGTDESQLSLEADPDEPPKGRVEVLARMLAGFQWPGRGFDRLTNPQQRAAIDAARAALKRVAEEGE